MGLLCSAAMSELVPARPPRFNGLTNGRAHLRLLAAVGILASAAIATGGLASLIAKPAPEPEPEPEPGRALGLVTHAVATADGAIELELRVREAELAATRARTALHDARQLGLDARELESFERRLEQLGVSPLEAVRRGYAPGGRPSGAQEHENEQRRAHLRAIASASREL
jgi:hypothetical protein